MLKWHWAFIQQRLQWILFLWTSTSMTVLDIKSRLEIIYSLGGKFERKIYKSVGLFCLGTEIFLQDWELQWERSSRVLKIKNWFGKKRYSSFGRYESLQNSSEGIMHFEKLFTSKYCNYRKRYHFLSPKIWIWEALMALQFLDCVLELQIICPSWTLPFQILGSRHWCYHLLKCNFHWFVKRYVIPSTI